MEDSLPTVPQSSTTYKNTGITLTIHSLTLSVLDCLLLVLCSQKSIAHNQPRPDPSSLPSPIALVWKAVNDVWHAENRLSHLFKSHPKRTLPLAGQQKPPRESTVTGRTTKATKREHCHRQDNKSHIFINLSIVRCIRLAWFHCVTHCLLKTILQWTCEGKQTRK